MNDYGIAIFVYCTINELVIEVDERPYSASIIGYIGVKDFMERGNNSALVLACAQAVEKRRI